MAKDDNTKLTTVKILKEVYSKFKRYSFDYDLSLQKLVNRSLHKYTTDEIYRKSINECNDLIASGSQF
jgi:hypothetical protein